VARGKAQKKTVAQPRLGHLPSLTLEEARQQLHKLASRFGRMRKPSDSLLDRAVDVGPHRRGGMLIVPEIDALEALDRLDAAERENDELLDELEDVGIILLAQERLAEPTPVDKLISLEELAGQFGREHLLAD
jgi:hypothetical protein